jgi:hypothetical protein
MNLELSDEEELALGDLLKRTIEADHYPLSPRVLTLKAILAKLEPASALVEPPPPPKHYEPPRFNRGRRRRG